MTLYLEILVAMICLIPCVYYLVDPKQDPFNPLFFVGITAFFIADYGAIISHAGALEYISDHDLSVYLVVTAISILGFYFGWAYRKRREYAPSKASSSSSVPVIRARILLYWAALIGFFGVACYLYNRGDFRITGYFLDLKVLWFIGALLALQSMVIDRTLAPYAILILLVCLIPPVDRFIVYGQRSDTFRVAILAIALFLWWGWRPRRAIIVPIMVLFALVLATLAQTRTIIAQGRATGRIDALYIAIPSFFEHDPDAKLYGTEEFVFGSGMVATVRAQGSYEYGAFLYNIAVRFLPKELFDKDALYTRWSLTNDIHNVGNNMGYKIPMGAFPSGMAFVFVQFGWACPIFWALLGYLSRIIYVRGLTPNIAAQGYLVTFFVILLLLITQDLNPFVMNTIYYIPALFIAYRFSRVRHPDAIGLEPLPETLDLYETLPYASLPSPR